MHTKMLFTAGLMLFLLSSRVVAQRVELNPAPQQLALCRSELWIPADVTPVGVICIADHGSGARVFRHEGWRRLATELRWAMALHKIIDRGRRPTLCKDKLALEVLRSHLGRLAELPRVYAGTSQAGAQAFALAWHEPGRCAAVVQMQSAVASVQWWTRDHATDEKMRSMPMLYAIGGRDDIGAKNGEPHACSRVLLRGFIGPAVAAGARWSAYLKSEEIHGGFGDQSYSLAWLRSVLRESSPGVKATLRWRVSERNDRHQEPLSLLPGHEVATGEFAQPLWFPSESLRIEAVSFMHISSTP